MEKKILIVDDNRDILELLKLILEMEGYNVSCLDDGSQLEDTIISYHPDLILLDIMLGPIDGRDLCRNLKGDPVTNQIPIIMISASHGTLSLAEKQCSADAFIPKPFEIDTLVSNVSQLVA
jgi:DNA-binding response OmpR family regulator